MTGMLPVAAAVGWTCVVGLLYLYWRAVYVARGWRRMAELLMRTHDSDAWALYLNGIAKHGERPVIPPEAPKEP